MVLELKARHHLAVNIKGGLKSSFFCAIIYENIISMDKDKLKLIIRNLEMLVDQLKTEVYSDVNLYAYDDIDPVELGYDSEYEGP